MINVVSTFFLHRFCLIVIFLLRRSILLTLSVFELYPDVVNLVNKQHLDRMCKSFLLFSVSLTLSFVSFLLLKCDLIPKNCSTFKQKHVLTIPCDFKFVEIDPFYPDKFLNRIDVSKIKNNSKANPFDFECEELDDKYLRTKSL